MNLYPSGSILNLVSRQTFLHLKNQWYVFHFGLVITPIAPQSLPSFKSNLLLRYSNLLLHLVLLACFWSCAFFLAIHCLFVLEAILTKDIIKFVDSAGNEDRTRDPTLTRGVLYRLSYASIHLTNENI